MIFENNAFWIFLIVCLVIMVAVFVIELWLCVRDRHDERLKDEILNEFDMMD